MLHGQTLWPCTGLDSSLDKPFQFRGPGRYVISANFTTTTDSAGESIYACTFRACST